MTAQVKFEMSSPCLISISLSDIINRIILIRLLLTVQLRCTCQCCFAPAASRSHLACRHTVDGATEWPTGHPHTPLQRLCSVPSGHAQLGSQQHNPPRPQDWETVSCPAVCHRQEQLNRYNSESSLMHMQTTFIRIYSWNDHLWQKQMNANTI